MGLLDGLVEPVGHDQPLARGLVVGPEPLAQHGVLHVVLEVGPARVGDHLHLRRVRVDDAVREQVEQLAQPVVERGELRRVAPELFFLLLGVFGVRGGHHHCAVRWNTESLRTRSAIAVMICTDVEPVPTIPTRAPSIGTP
ncbi:MAG: hypothetical protein KatS3mg010_2003 [Acidimicrobiia bacterium]|nr:MAG: hypothetical protein KatS3mg010_2003 [Acidimicrobiia bacterium]